jgi:hypothetical protein
MRAEAYDAAAAAAVAQSDIDRNDPALIARDFTQQLTFTEGHHGVDHFVPCPLAGSELIGRWEAIGAFGRCWLSPGLGGVRRPSSQCPWQTCIIISVRSETWADQVTREAIISTLGDFNKVCTYARAYGPNHRFDAMSAGCSRASREKVMLAIEVKPRVDRPCTYKENSDGRTYEPFCTNQGALLIKLGNGG